MYTVYIVYIRNYRRPTMDIIIRNTGDVPIYEQIVRQIKAQILRGS